eukprot:TRINITY_DN25160_c0_g1_i1.p1 TRINITY_DN25160_c0_g1~~TRINITY_DN25160_c0_g1_i1.p1  ORF type:complete len:261 (+),score=55.50 TRINITY_DN25160_c0_g1_i1:76-783(+)
MCNVRRAGRTLPGGACGGLTTALLRRAAKPCSPHCLSLLALLLLVLPGAWAAHVQVEEEEARAHLAAFILDGSMDFDDLLAGSSDAKASIPASLSSSSSSSFLAPEFPDTATRPSPALFEAAPLQMMLGAKTPEPSSADAAVTPAEGSTTSAAAASPAPEAATTEPFGLGTLIVDVFLGFFRLVWNFFSAIFTVIYTMVNLFIPLNLVFPVAILVLAFCSCSSFCIFLKFWPRWW